MSLNVIFQFHKGTIRTDSQQRERQNVENFNSIKVRLELHSRKVSTFMLIFQFHKGTIRTLDNMQKENIPLISIP